MFTYFSFSFALAAALALSFALAFALALSSKGTLVAVGQHRVRPGFVGRRAKLGITVDTCAGGTCLSYCTECDDEEELENVTLEHGAGYFW